MKGLLIGLALLFAVPCWAGEKEELQLQKQVILERMDKLKAQSQIIAMQFEISKSELQTVESKLNPILEKEKKEKDATPVPGKR